jgi:plasmid stabilization system protein ParE
MKIKWSTSATASLKHIFDYIKVDSLQNAETVVSGIIDSVSALDQLIVHRPDKYKRNNDGSYRAFEIFSYRISYRITPQEIKILRLRHVKMRPKMF